MCTRLSVLAYCGKPGMLCGSKVNTSITHECLKGSTYERWQHNQLARKVKIKINRGVPFSCKAKSFAPATAPSDRLWIPLSLLSVGYFAGEVTIPSSADVQNGWSCTPTSPYRHISTSKCIILHAVLHLCHFPIGLSKVTSFPNRPIQGHQAPLSNSTVVQVYCISFLYQAVHLT